MPTYEVAAPDGTKYQATVPAGTSPADVLSYVQKQHTAPQQPAQSPGDAAFAAGKQAGQSETGLAAGLDQAARQYLPLGLGTDVGAAARYVGQRVTGVKNPDTFATDLAYSGGQSQGETEGSPTASTVGGLAGGVGQAAALTPLLRAAMPFKSALALRTAAQGGSKVGNAAKLLAQGAIGGSELGAAQGTVQGGINGGQPSAAGAVEGGAQGAVTGAAIGAATGGLAAGAVPLARGLSAAVRRVAGSQSQASQDSIAALAKVFSMSPTDLQSARDQFQTDAGRPPAMGELTDLYNRGELHAMVGKNPILGARVAGSAADAAASLPGRLTAQAAATIGPGEDTADLVQARQDNMDRAMTPIRNQMIPLEPQDVEFLRGEVLPNSGLTQLGRRAVHADLDTGELSVGSADTLRKSLNQRAQANPGEGFAELAHGIRQIAEDGSPEYSAALGDYASDSRYINGHAHGLTGKTTGQTSDPGLIADLNTPEGRYGYQSGLASRYNNALGKSEASAATTARSLTEDTGANRNLDNTFTPAIAGQLRDAARAESGGLESLSGIAPNLPKQTQGPNAGQVALSVVSHSWPMRVYHAIQAHLGAGMPDNVARITARYLTDPAYAQQGIALMARHGVDQAATQALLQRAATAGSVAGTQAAGQGQ